MQTAWTIISLVLACALIAGMYFGIGSK